MMEMCYCAVCPGCILSRTKKSKSWRARNTTASWAADRTLLASLFTANKKPTSNSLIFHVKAHVFFRLKRRLCFHCLPEDPFHSETHWLDFYFCLFRWTLKTAGYQWLQLMSAYCISLRSRFCQKTRFNCITCKHNTAQHHYVKPSVVSTRWPQNACKCEQRCRWRVTGPLIPTVKKGFAPHSQPSATKGHRGPLVKHSEIAMRLWCTKP